jgi:sugar lactone lactonase YvrE
MEILGVLMGASTNLPLTVPARPFVATGLVRPQGLAFDQFGNLFEADSGTGNIFKFTPSGAKTTFVSWLNSPMGLAFDSSGNIYVSDPATFKITKITRSGIQSTFVTAEWTRQGIAFDRSGSLFVAESGQAQVVSKFTPAG